MSEDHALSTLFLAPQDASPRAEVPGWAEWSHAGRSFTRDLAGHTETGQALTGLPPGYLHGITPAGDLLLTDAPFWDGAQRLRSIRLDPPAKRLEVRWQLDLPAGRSNGAGKVLCGGDLLLCSLATDRLLALDRDTGAVRWSRTTRLFGSMVDTHGFVTLLSRRFEGPRSWETALACFGPEGEERWAIDGAWSPRALGPDVVVAGEHHRDGSQSWLLERSSGRKIAPLAQWTPAASREPLVVVMRDVVISCVAQAGTVAVIAVKTTGERLWAVAMGTAPIVSIVPGPGRLWILDAEGRLCVLRGQP